MEVKLRDLLRQAEDGTLQLPDFQRGWVWDNDHIVSLLASISSSYPIGAVMTLQTGNPDVRFRSRLIEGVGAPTSGSSPDPSHLLLDGQQRLTSLYMALRSPDAVPTKDSRGHAYRRYYYADIRAALDLTRDREEDVIVSVPEDRTERTDFGRVVKRDLTTRENEVQRQMFPLNIVLDAAKTMAWMGSFLKAGSSMDERLQTWTAFNDTFVAPFYEYQVPVIDLPQSTTKHAVCNVFEKVNTGGVTLTVFELLTATYAAEDFSLRDDWAKRSAELSGRDYKRLLGNVKAIDFLQIVTLLSTYHRRRTHLQANPGDDRAPAVSCKRRDILSLDLADYKRWADSAMEGLRRAAAFLHGQYIFASKDMPYPTQIIPLSAILSHGKGLATDAQRRKLAQWLWCGIFGEMYGGSTETRFANDVPECTAWLTSDGDAPRTVQDAQFQAERLLTLRTRNSAAYKGVFVLLLKNGTRDILTGDKIDVNVYFDRAVDIHHVFPRRWCDKNGIKRSEANCCVNKTAITERTSRGIRSRDPSAYLEWLEKEGVNSQTLDAFLDTHGVDPVTLRQDDFETFFNKRFEWLVSQIATVMGKDVNRNDSKNESPFHRDPSARIESLIAGGETANVEFKSTGRFDLRTGNKGHHIEWAVAKSVAGLLNAWGGALLVGVDDSGQLVGIEKDYPFMKSQNRDGWQQWLTTLLANSLGMATATRVSVSFARTHRKTIALIEVPKGDKPTFATNPKGHREQVFLARVGVTTRRLAGAELLEYQRQRWPGLA